MIKIGELAKICNISIQTLRYYDKIGLLQADRVDNESGYRYYSPERIKDYQVILRLKKLDFSLEECKRFLTASRREQLKLYAAQKTKLEANISENRSKIQEIDSLCQAIGNGAQTKGEKIIRAPFADDPEVIGKWQLCGEMPLGKKSFPQELLPCKDFIFQELFFLPGGGHVWSYFWTKGILYVNSAESNISVPNEYHIFRHEGETYLSLNWMVDKCWNPDAKDCVLIYRQVDNKQYTEKETFSYRDNVNLPFSPDERLLGHWNTVDVIFDLAEFEDQKRKPAAPPYFYQKIAFYDRGICKKTFINGKQRIYLYTKGYVLDRELEFAENYLIRSKQGNDYLILEHKSGDYAYLGKVFCYYVFQKEKHDETNE